MVDKRFDLFVSYCHKDKDAVMALCKNLKDREFELWIDTEQNQKYNDLNQMMKKGIDESELFICCASTNHNNSENCLKEHNYAKKEKLIYVLIEKFKDQEDMLEKLDKIALDLKNKIYYTNENIDDLVKRINNLLKRETFQVN